MIIALLAPAAYADNAMLEAEIPRGAAVGILIDFLNLTEYAEQTAYSDRFADVAEDHPWAINILYAYEIGMTKGVSDTEFEPFLSITAAEFITMYLRYATGDTAISPDNLLEANILKNPYYNQYVAALMGQELFTESQMEETLLIFSGLADPGILLETYPTNIVQEGQLLYIPSYDNTWEIKISDESLLKLNGTRTTDRVYYMFTALETGWVTVTMTSDCELMEYELYILKDGKGEGMFGLTRGEVNTMLLDGIAEIELMCNPTTGYTWLMVPHDSIELIQDLYTPDPVGEDIVGSGGTQKLTFTAHEAGETEITLKYCQPWEIENDGIWTIVLKINVVESF